MWEGKVKFFRDPFIRSPLKEALCGIGLCPKGIIPTILWTLLYAFESLLAWFGQPASEDCWRQTTNMLVSLEDESGGCLQDLRIWGKLGILFENAN